MLGSKLNKFKEIFMFSKNIFLFSLLIIILSSNLLISQNICPPDTGTNCTDWNYGTYQTTTDNPDCVLSVYYRWRNCDNNYQIFIDGYQSQGNCTFLNQTGGSFKDWVHLLLIEEMSNLTGQFEPPDCPDSNLKVIFYTASCGLWVKCDYTIDSTTRVCDVDWRGSYPDYNVGEEQKVSFWKWQYCGYSCCKKTYTICKTFNWTDNKYDLIINAISKEQIGECTNPDNFVQPCEGGC